MQDEALEELLVGEGDGGVASGAENDALGVESDDARIGESDAMGVAADVAKELLGTTEGGLGVDNPACLIEAMA